MTNILITSSSRKVSLVKSFKDALKKEGGGRVVVADSNPFSASFYVADKYYILPTDSSHSFLPEIFKICKTNKINLIIPTRDEELIIFSRNKSEFKKKGIEIMVASEKTIRTCQDKLEFFNFCKDNGVGCPKLYTTKEVESGKVKFPLFINGRVSKASKNAFKVNDKKELDAYLKIIPNPVIQEYIPAKEYTVDLFADFDGTIFSVVPRERIKIFGGESFVSKTFNNKTLINESIRLSQKLGLVGHNTMQCFFDGKEVKFIEVNPRYGGAANLSFKAGADTARLLIRIMKGKKVEPQIGKFEDGLIMLRYTDDFFISKKGLLK